MVFLSGCCHQVLDQRQVPWREHGKAQDQPNASALEHKESYRWLQNLKQSTTLLAEPERIMHIGSGERHLRVVLCRP